MESTSYFFKSLRAHLSINQNIPDLSKQLRFIVCIREQVEREKLTKQESFDTWHGQIGYVRMQSRIAPLMTSSPLCSPGDINNGIASPFHSLLTTKRHRSAFFQVKQSNSTSPPGLGNYIPSFLLSNIKKVQIQLNNC